MPQTAHLAYFCMEFGVHESYPVYAGGLGVLAGDFIKSAHDLKLPVVAVTLRWDRGYGVQRIGPDGRWTVIEVECLGACGFATPILVDDDFIENVTPEKVKEIVRKYL